MNSRAVSEVVGALLTVVVIVTTAGIIYLMSYPTIMGSVDSVAYRNAVRNMVETKELVERMKFGNEIATTKTMQFGGSIYTSKTFRVNISGNNLDLGDLVMEVSGKRIVFESGIFEESYGVINPFPISYPSIAVTNDAAYFTFYNFGGNFSARGSRVTVNFLYKGTNKMNANYLEINSRFCELWKDVIEKALEGFGVSSINFNDTDCSDQRIGISGSMEIFLVDIEVK